MTRHAGQGAAGVPEEPFGDSFGEPAGGPGAPDAVPFPAVPIPAGPIPAGPIPAVPIPAWPIPAVPIPAVPIGPTRPRRRGADQTVSRAANRRWWDADADAYHAEHGDFLGDADLVWCPENLRESDVHLLGAVAGRRILEVGCGSAPCARYLVRQGADVVAFDVSAGMLAHGRAAAGRTGTAVPLVQADVCELPFRDGSFDLAFSAFGGIPFVADSAGAMREVARVLRPGGRWVFSVTHPMRWAFPDDPGPVGLTAIQSYFDRAPYVEVDEAGVPAYVEHHRTMGDRIREIVGAGLTVLDVLEPEWPEGFTGTWGQWSPLRGEIFPGTAIFLTERPRTS